MNLSCAAKKDREDGTSLCPVAAQGTEGEGGYYRNDCTFTVQQTTVAPQTQ